MHVSIEIRASSPCWFCGKAFPWIELKITAAFELAQLSAKVGLTEQKEGGCQKEIVSNQALT
ncbi:MAG: DUF2321 domain-containing protein [Candidatus Brocadia sp.]